MRKNNVNLLYAKALIEVSFSKNKLDKIKNDFEIIIVLLQKNKELSYIINSKFISSQKKTDIFNEILLNKIDKYLFNFLILIIKNNREESIFEIYQSFLQIYKKYNKKANVKLIIADKISDKTKDKIKKNIEKQIKEEVKLEIGYDKQIIGGMILNIENKQIDMSIKNKLNKLTNSLME